MEPDTLLWLLSVLLPIAIAAIIVADLIQFRKYEYIVVEDKSTALLLTGLKGSLIASAIVFVLTLSLMLISAVNTGGDIMVFILFFISACLILGILALPWIIYGGYLLIKTVIKK